MRSRPVTGAQHPVLEVTSHVGRDLLASAQLFRDAKDVVWEYVVNSLQYVARGTPARVQVIVQPRKSLIEIRDNGHGMDADGLAHYFKMHGENRDRREGRPGRGKFGTGKSAAFGIAKRLRVDTRRSGTRNVVELTRNAVDASGGASIPLDWLERDQPTDLPDGTTVTISEIVLSKIDTQRIIEYIERHLQAFRASDPEVAVNDHVCRYREPETDGAPRVFRPTGAAAKELGEIELVVRVSRAPLSESEIGVIVTAGEGAVLAIESGGMERKEFGNYLFGSVDVPALDQEVDGIAAYDATRSLRLNINHPLVARLVPFIGSSLEEVRRELVTRAREASRTEEARRLTREADKIAKVLNQDFEAVRRRLADIRSASASQGAVASAFGGGRSAGEEPTDWVEGSAAPGTLERTGSGKKGAGTGRLRPDIPAAGTPNPEGIDTVEPSGGSGQKPRPRGGFSVEYERLGEMRPRSEFDSTALKIIINLDHPVVVAALAGGGPEDVAFRRLSYEVAFSEYAIALQYRLLEQDPDIPGDEILYDVRDTLNRVSRAAAALYA